MADGATIGRSGKLGLMAGIALVMGNMIGSGVFLLPSSLAPFGWNAVIGWIVTICGALVLAFILSRLTRELPRAGDPTGFVGSAFGEFPAFLIGWIYLVSVWVGVVTIAVAAVSYLSSFLPWIGSTALAPAACAILLVWVVTLVNLRGVHSAGNFQIVTTALKVVPLLVVIVIAAGVMLSGNAEYEPFDASSINLGAVNGAATLTLWALLGFESASVVAAQVRDPEVNIPKATLWGTAFTGLLYLFVCSAIALLLPQEVATGSPAPFATFVERYWSAGPAALVAAFAIISCVGALNGWVLMHGELPRSMAADGMLPRWLAGTDGLGTPRNALLASSAIASLFVVLNATKGMQGLFEFLLLLSTSAALWLYLACALAAWKLGIVRGAALAGAVYSIWALWGAGVEASLWSFALMALGLPLYWWVQRDRRIANISEAE